MAKPDSIFRAVSPGEVLREVSEAIPADCRKNMIIIGSLAAGFRYFAERTEMLVRTKDADCLLSPRLEAVPAGTAITEKLLDAGWRFHKSEQWTKPGSSDTPDDQLPAVRLEPPNGSEWFVELLAVPNPENDRGRTWARIETHHGHFGLCSFGFLSLTDYDPIKTDFGIYIARPEMMALANMLEHPTIGSEIMSGGFAGRPDIKRSNKDLGRVVAIAWLAVAEDHDAVLGWSDAWREALQDRFPDVWRKFAGLSGSGVRCLLASSGDLEQAWYTCTNGLLASDPPTQDAFRIAAERLLVDAVEPLERMAR